MYGYNVHVYGYRPTVILTPQSGERVLGLEFNFIDFKDDSH